MEEMEPREKTLQVFRRYRAEHHPEEAFPSALLSPLLTHSKLKQLCSAYRRAWDGAGSQSSRLETATGQLRIALESGRPTEDLVRTLLNVAEESTRALLEHEALAVPRRAATLERLQAGPGSIGAPTDLACFSLASRVLGVLCAGDSRWHADAAAQSMHTQHLLLSATEPRLLPALLRTLDLPRFPTPLVTHWTQVGKLAAFLAYCADRLVPPGVLVRWTAGDGVALDLWAASPRALDVSNSICSAAGGAAASSSAAQLTAPPSAAVILLHPPHRDAGAATLFRNVPATIGGGTASLPLLCLCCVVWAQAPTQRGVPLWRVETIPPERAGEVAASLFSAESEASASPLDCPVLLAYASEPPSSVSSGG